MGRAGNTDAADQCGSGDIQAAWKRMKLKRQLEKQVGGSLGRRAVRVEGVVARGWMDGWMDPRWVRGACSAKDAVCRGLGQIR